MSELIKVANNMIGNRIRNNNASSSPRQAYPFAFRKARPNNLYTIRLSLKLKASHRPRHDLWSEEKGHCADGRKRTGNNA